MGHVLSSSTIYATAYLTDKGREYLYDPIKSNRIITDENGNLIDLFRIQYFSLSDPDYNYNVDSDYPLETGDIANVTGKNEGCIKGTALSNEENLILVNYESEGSDFPDIDRLELLPSNGGFISINLSLDGD